MRALVLLLAAGMLSAAPLIKEIEPLGGQRGKTVRLLVRGTGLAAGDRIETSLPGQVSRLGAVRESEGLAMELAFLVDIAKDAPTGAYPMRLLTGDGLTNVVLFSVSDLPEQQEKETAAPKQGNNTPEAAQTLAVPGVMTGTLAGADVDVFSFAAKAGEKLVFEVEANALGSAIDPAFEILDPGGRILARNDDAPGTGIDARSEVAFPKAGTYFVRVHDSKYSSQTINFYRLKAGRWQFAEAVFPLGGQRGKPAAATLIGGNLAQPVEVKPDTASGRQYVRVNVPGSSSLPLLFLLSNDPEMAEGEDRTLRPGVVVNGRIAQPKEVDRYRLAVQPKEHWVFEVTASRLGTSRLDALVTIRDAKGKKLISRDDLAGSDPVLPFEIPEGTSEVEVAIEDLLGRGGAAYGYRLMARREPADFTLTLATPYVNIPAGGTASVAVNVQRRGYDGALQVVIPNLPDGFRQAGGHVAPAAAAQRFDDPNPRFSAVRSTITISAPAEAQARAVELSVTGVADTPDGRIVRTAEGPGLVTAVSGLKQKAVTAAWLEMQLPAAVARPAPARLESGIPLVRIAQGVEFPLKYKVVKGPNVRLQGRVRNTIASSVGNLRINEGLDSKNAEAGSLLVSTNFATPTETFDMLLEASAEADGSPLTMTAPIVSVQVVPGYQLRLPGDRIRVTAGSKFTIGGTVYREPTFEGGLVKISAADLPEGVACADTEAAAGTQEFALACEASGNAAAGIHEIRLSSSAPETGRRAKDTYKIPDLAVKLEVSK